MRVLIVEDNLFYSELLEYAIQRKNHDVTCCVNSEDAITLLQESQDGYDLVIIDYNLMGGTADPVIEYLQSLKDPPKTLANTSVKCVPTLNRLRSSFISKVMSKDNEPIESIEYLLMDASKTKRSSQFSVINFANLLKFQF